jgi:hypothetical protein
MRWSNQRAAAIPIAVAVDLQERAASGQGTAAAGALGEPHIGGRVAQRGGLQPAKQPQDQGRRQPSAQFAHINTQVPAASAEKQPVISVDTKKKELVGHFRNNGREYRPQKIRKRSGSAIS